MKSLLLCVLMLASTTTAEITQNQRDKTLKATADIVTEKLDEFEKRVSLSYSGPEIHMPTTEGELSAVAYYPAQDIQAVSFMFTVSRVGDGWRWLRFNTFKMLVNGERLRLEDDELSSDVFDSGQVYEAKHISVSLVQLMQICAAPKVKVQLGGDEWEWNESHKLPMIAVLAAWIARGGDVSAYEDLKKRIFHPVTGMDYATVVKKFGEPSLKDPSDGWATWEWFWLQFKDGKVIEARQRPVKAKSAQ